MAVMMVGMVGYGLGHSTHISHDCAAVLTPPGCLWEPGTTLTREQHHKSAIKKATRKSVYATDARGAGHSAALPGPVPNFCRKNLRDVYPDIENGPRFHRPATGELIIIEMKRAVEGSASRRGGRGCATAATGRAMLAHSPLFTAANASLRPQAANQTAFIAIMVRFPAKVKLSRAESPFP